jgi:hypothetical protein
MVDVDFEQAGVHVDEELVLEGDEEVDDDELKDDVIAEWKSASIKHIWSPFDPYNQIMLINTTGHRLLVRGALRSRPYFLQCLKLAFGAENMSADLEMQWQEVRKAAERAGEVVLELTLEVDGDTRAAKVDVPKGEQGFDIVSACSQLATQSRKYAASCQ